MKTLISRRGLGKYKAKLIKENEDKARAAEKLQLVTNHTTAFRHSTNKNDSFILLA